MFRRAFWFGAGAATGVWATTKVNRKLRSLAPDSLAVRAADQALAAGHRLKDFALDVRAGMAQREIELNDALGLTASTDPGAAGQAEDRRGLAGRAPHRTALGATHPYDRNEDH
ncbi:DUF6167 family protein [Streptomyces sp. CNQ085]|uniref:DUF6167 family protein n=1 Tax=Streptomyces sp. CNQ085 TaxID=2886944 RepID=UPI001F508DF6|nr:DUF6167 family protein [Streptomyces sp. CNQ085]MCI0383367.1 DUF6167 family protein [Streptomyces sp. CNQ085]